MATEFSRREMLQRMLFAGAGVWLSYRLPLCAWAAEPVPVEVRRKAKAVIQLWMWGGPSHLDTFDPKPEAGNDYCGPFNKPIETNIPGIRINEQLPLLARQADKYSIIRSMTPRERRHPDLLNASRKRRIASGSGTQVQDVNELLRQFEQTRQMAKRMGGLQKRLRHRR